MNRAALAAIAVALPVAAAAQTGLRLEKIEPLGDWAAVSVAGTTMFVTATPFGRPARAYCLSSYLKVPYDAMPGYGAEIGADAEKIGALRSFACLRLACRAGTRDLEVSLTANAAPDSDETGMPLGVTLRIRAGAAPIASFERADIGRPSRDGAFALLNWSVSGRREGAIHPYAQVSLAFAAPITFADRLSAETSVGFELRPGQDREIAAFKHGARNIAFSLAGTTHIANELHRLCGRGN